MTDTEKQIAPVIVLLCKGHYVPRASWFVADCFREHVQELAVLRGAFPKEQEHVCVEGPEANCLFQAVERAHLKGDVECSGEHLGVSENPREVSTAPKI